MVKMLAEDGAKPLRGDGSKANPYRIDRANRLFMGPEGTVLVAIYDDDDGVTSLDYYAWYTNRPETIKEAEDREDDADDSGVYYGMSAKDWRAHSKMVSVALGATVHLVGAEKVDVRENNRRFVVANET